MGYLATHLLGVVKWRLTLHLSNARLTFAQALRCYYAGLFGTVFLPSVVGGDVVRMGLAFRIERNRAGVLLGSLVDRLLDTISLAVVAGIGVLLLPGALDPRHRRAFVALAVVFTLACGALFLLLRTLPWRRLPFKLRRALVKIRLAWRSMASRPAIRHDIAATWRHYPDESGCPFGLDRRRLRPSRSLPRLAFGVAPGEAPGLGSTDAGWPGDSRGGLGSTAGSVWRSGCLGRRRRTGLGIHHHRWRPGCRIDLVSNWRNGFRAVSS